jgi:hypothetical protein
LLLAAFRIQGNDVIPNRVDEIRRWIIEGEVGDMRAKLGHRAHY